MNQNSHEQFFNILHQDHEEIQGMFKEMERVSDGERQRLFKGLKQELLPHQEAEESAFYPFLEKNQDTRADAAEAIAEHEEAENIVKELDGMSPDSGEWMTKFHDLVKGVIHHVTEEESKIFDDARNVITEEQMRTITKAFQNEKEKVKSGTSGMR